MCCCLRVAVAKGVHEEEHGPLLGREALQRSMQRRIGVGFRRGVRSGSRNGTSPAQVVPGVGLADSKQIAPGVGCLTNPSLVRPRPRGHVGADLGPDLRPETSGEGAAGSFEVWSDEAQEVGLVGHLGVPHTLVNPHQTSIVSQFAGASERVQFAAFLSHPLGRMEG